MGKAGTIEDRILTPEELDYLIKECSMALIYKHTPDDREKSINDVFDFVLTKGIAG